METVALFIDVANLVQAFRSEQRLLDLLGLRGYLAGGRRIAETFVFLPMPPGDSDLAWYEPAQLQREGFLVRTRPVRIMPSGSWKADMDVDIAVTAMRYAGQASADTMVLASGDSDFVPLVIALRDRGLRVEVASHPASLSDELARSASGVIDLAQVDDLISVAAYEQAPEEWVTSHLDFEGGGDWE